MKTTINTNNDTVREAYVFGADLVGQYDFPQLKPINAHVENLIPIPFHTARGVKRPKECFIHFFEHDYMFERVWNNSKKYLDILRNFKYVCGPDFSAYGDMPKALQIYNRYRSRAMAYWFQLNGINVIPTVGWGEEETYDYCFDGLPKNSTLAVSTNGCFSITGKENYRKGFNEMCKRLSPNRVVVVGREIQVDTKVEVIYKNSHGQDMTYRLGGKQ